MSSGSVQKKHSLVRALRTLHTRITRLEADAADDFGWSDPMWEDPSSGYTTPNPLDHTPSPEEHFQEEDNDEDNDDAEMSEEDAEEETDEPTDNDSNATHSHDDPHSPGFDPDDPYYQIYRASGSTLPQTTGSVDGDAVHALIREDQSIAREVNAMYRLIVLRNGTMWNHIATSPTTNTIQIEEQAWQHDLLENGNTIRWTTDVNAQRIELFVEMDQTNRTIMIYWTYGSDNTRRNYHGMVFFRHNPLVGFHFVNGVCDFGGIYQ